MNQKLKDILEKAFECIGWIINAGLAILLIVGSLKIAHEVLCAWFG